MQKEKQSLFSLWISKQTFQTLEAILKTEALNCKASISSNIFLKFKIFEMSQKATWIDG